jgi:Asp-tRNA(Asn)/Glu-tRNA(Gln) amidotransferase B subunit
MNETTGIRYGAVSAKSLESDIVYELCRMAEYEYLETIIKEIIAQNPQEVARYKAGAEKLFGFFDMYINFIF